MKNNKKTFLVLALLSLSLLLSGCMKGKQKVKQNFTFKVSALQAGIPLSGGSFVRAISSASNTLIKLDTNDSAEFPLGSWAFYTISYEGPAPMSGKKYCGSVSNVNLSQAAHDVSLTINEANCLSEPFLTLIADVSNTYGSKLFSTSNVQLINNQLVITGTGLDLVSNVNINGTSFNQNFSIESKTSTQIIANPLNNFTFDVAKVFNLILSDAVASSSYTIDFSLCNSTLGTKSFDCTVVPNDKEVLSYDSVSGKWKPRALNGLSYLGVWDATGSAPTATTSGEYYLVSVAGSGYAVGDWTVYNGTTFDKVANGGGVSTVFGRTGAIISVKGDYVLNKMGDVDLTTTPPSANQYLKFDGTNWIPGTVSLSEADPSVLAFAKTALPTCTAGQVLNSNGSSFSCVTDATGTFSGTASKLVVTDGSGNLATTTVTANEANYLSGVTSNIQAQLNSLSSSVLSTMLSGFTTGTNAAVTAADSILNAIGKLQAQVNSLNSGKLSLTGGTLTVGTINGVPAPTNLDDVANKSYVDSRMFWQNNGVDAYLLTGSVGVGTATPSYNLHVVGTAGLSTGTSWTNASDIRLKNILGDYQYGLDEVLKLHTVRYSYKKNNQLNLPSNIQKTGFIAQEVEKVIPDAVSLGSDGFLRLNVDPIHWAVVNSIKDLYRKFILPLWTNDKSQDQKIAALETENAELRMRLEAIEKIVIDSK